MTYWFPDEEIRTRQQYGENNGELSSAYIECDQYPLSGEPAFKRLDG